MKDGDRYQFKHSRVVQDIVDISSEDVKDLMVNVKKIEVKHIASKQKEGKRRVKKTLSIRDQEEKGK